MIPKRRTREEQDRHNLRRREAKQKGKQGVFTMQYMLAKYPEIYTEVCEFFTELKNKYPGKRDLSKTYEFKQIKNKATKITDAITLEPHLKINLISINNQVSTNNNNNIQVSNNVVVEQEAPFINMETNDIEKLIEELRQDPDLMCAFNDIVIEDPGMETTVEEFCSPVDKETQEIADKETLEIAADKETLEIAADKETQEIAKIVREISEDAELMSAFNDIEFDHLGEDLPEVDDIFW